MGLWRFILRRLATALPTLLILSVFVFLLQHLLPGDPAAALAGEEHSPEILAQIRAEYGFDQPLVVQYVRWLAHLCVGDLGESLRTHTSVAALIADKLPVTLELAVLAMLLAVVLAIPGGMLAAMRHRRLSGTLVDFAGLLGISVPHFWLGIMMILLFSVRLGWLPSSGYVPPWEDLPRNLLTLAMPAFVLATGVAGVLLRHTRSAMMEEMSADHVRTARAKGLGERAVAARHILRNALLPVITLGALEFGRLLSGAVLTEQIFSIPGFGKLMIDAVFNREYAVVQGVTMVTGLLFVGVSLAADILSFLANPVLRP